MSYLRSLGRGVFAPVMVLAFTISPGVARAADPSAVLEQMPADLAIAVAFGNMEEFDKSVQAVTARLSQGQADQGMLADLKGELGQVGDWIDFSKPIGLGWPDTDHDEPTLWAQVPDFEEKMKSIEGATREDGVWQATFEGTVMYAREQGGYVIAGTDRAVVAQEASGTNLLSSVKPRQAVWSKRDVLIRFNMNTLRPKVMMGLEQGGMMMLAMGPAMFQQTGNPAMMTGMLSGILEGAKEFVKQAEYIEIYASVDAKAFSGVVLGGFAEGGIKTYLTEQKPAGVPLLMTVPDEPYLMAMGYHLPASNEKLVDFFAQRIQQGAAPLMGMQETEEETEGDKPLSLDEAIALTKRMYLLLAGSNMTINLTPNGMRSRGDYITSDPKGMMAVLHESMAGNNPLTQMGGPAEMESLGTRTIGDVEVDEFSIVFDDSDPTMAMIGNIYGKELRLAFGIVGDRVRFAMGDTVYIDQAFSQTKIDVPLAENKFAKQVLAELPREYNGVILFDLGSLVPLMGQFMGGGAPQAGSVPPGPPIAITTSMHEEPARVDIYVPIRAIERVMQAFQPQESM